LVVHWAESKADRLVVPKAVMRVVHSAAPSAANLVALKAVTTVARSVGQMADCWAAQWAS